MKQNLKTAARTAWLSVGLGLATAAAARAQDAGAFTNLAANNAMIEMMYANTMNIDRHGKQISADAWAGKAGKTAAPATSRPVSLAYAPTPALKQQTVQTYVDRLKTKNPAAAQAVAANFGPGKHDYGQIYQGIVKGYGVRDNDAADALVANLVLGYLIVNNLQGNGAVTPAMVRGVRTQFAPKLAQNPKLTTPGVPAQLGEQMKLLFVITQGGWQSAIQEKTLPAYQQGIGAMFKNQYGLDMALVKLTDQGFVKK